jgi:hypothetical protein
VIATDPDAVIQTWNSVKRAEPGKENRGQRAPIDELPASMPITLKLAEVEKVDGSVLSDADSEAISFRIASDLQKLARAGVPLDSAIERAWRILDR